MASRTKVPSEVVKGHTIEWKPPDELHFDAENPRLREYLETDRPSQSELLRLLWQLMSVDELAYSISSSGFYHFEPLIALNANGCLIVVEGNRRLAAVKLLRDPSLRKKLKATDLPAASDAVLTSLNSLPVLICASREEVWRYLGFKHVNGPAKWGSFAKATYIAEVHDEYGVELDAIAAQIGDRHRTVRRLYRALKVLQQAESSGVFDRENRFSSHFSFSHLYTGLTYEGIQNFLQLKDEDSEDKQPVPKSRRRQLGELCVWLFGDKTTDTPPIVESQNPHLRQLDEVLKSPRAVESLRARMPLSVALEISYGDEVVFRKALIQAKESLQKARGTASTGFDGSPDVLRTAEEVATIADDLVIELSRKASVGKTRRRHSEGQK